MTEEIYIDGVNVAGCEYFNKVVNEEPYCNIDEEHLYTCSSDESCYYKQLKRLEQEKFALTQESQQKSQTICELEQENKELKKDVQLFKCLDTFGENECHCACRCLGNEFCEDADKKINTYRSALEEIKSSVINYLPKENYKFAKSFDPEEFELLENILTKINEVLGC